MDEIRFVVLSSKFFVDIPQRYVVQLAAQQETKYGFSNVKNFLCIF